MTPLTALSNKEADREDPIRADLRQRVNLVCFCRLLFLILLILPLALAGTGGKPPQALLQFVREGHSIAFLIAGFGLTLFFLLSWQWFYDILFFFRMQLLADCALCTYLVIITGGATSYFYFLFLGVIFLYGRLLGFRTARHMGWAISCILLALALLQYSQPLGFLQPALAIREAFYYPAMQLISILLIYLLLRMGYTSEHRLLHELARQQLQLRRSEELKSQVFDWMHSALLVVDRGGYVTTINQAGLELAGIRHHHKALGTHLSEIFPFLAELWQEWDQRESFRTEARQQDRILGTTFAALPGGMGSLILFRDITRIKALEEQVKQMDKMASLGELAAGLAHELKNPLAGVKASLQLLQQNRISAQQQEKLHSVLQKDITRMDRLVRDFLNFARPEEATPQETDLGDRVESCLEFLRNLHPEVSFEAAPSLEGVNWVWDPDQLQQILMNLLLNAAQACAGSRHPLVRISLERDSEGEHLSITDNGPGLDREMNKKIFDPFITTKQNGSGLGLSIALRLANQNRSWIELRNLSRGGTEARLYSPRPAEQDI